jgi:hypothetical protein
MGTPSPSSQRTLGPMLMFARSKSLAEEQGNIKMDPGVRRDDDTGLGLTRMKTMPVAAA